MTAEHANNVLEIIDDIRENAENERDKGTQFERLCRYYLLNDPLWSRRLEKVWMWNDAPTKKGADYGIDLVALDVDGSYWAIQCKCYADDATLTYKSVATFYAAAGSLTEYQHNMIMTTTGNFTSNLKKVIDAWNTTVILSESMAESNIDFQPFLDGTSPQKRFVKEPREYQREMIDSCIEGFKAHDRGKLIMACGTGKTLTSLRLAEEQCGKGCTVLFLAPSIALVGQSMRNWVNDARDPMRVSVVCSDEKASNPGTDTWESSLIDIPYPATTDAQTLYRQLKNAKNPDGLTVVFSTYQSIQVVADAQAMGLDDFDLIICDEAHRTTGAAEDERDKSEFLKVHDNSIVRANKRLYMTATEKIYGEKIVKKAKAEDYLVSSMDDETTFGPEFNHISFARAIDENLLTDYKIVALSVEEKAVSKAYQLAMANSEDTEFEIPEAAKIIGLYKGLLNQGKKDGKPLRNAVAFCSTIAESERICEYFTKVVDAYREVSGETGAPDLRCELDHVDGSMNSNVRKQKLEWLAERPEDEDVPVCRILTNARCLAEGVDVPNLDAVIFLQPKKSEVDIVQAVGRVMRRFEGKDYGYIILPVVIPAGMTNEEALDNSDNFAIIWKVVQALRSHDERLEARINAIPFDHSSVVDVNPIDIDDDDNDDKHILDGDEGIQTDFFGDIENAVNAKLVAKCGTRVYWDEWAKSISKIAEKHIERITDLVKEGQPARETFLEFLQSLRDSLNDGITEDEAIEMLAQHQITLPVFEALFQGNGFAESNPISIAMEGMLKILSGQQLVSQEDARELNDLYESVRIRAKSIKTDAGRQSVIKELYEKFFSEAFKATSDKMGIVYTPNEVVNFILHATDRLLKQEFGRGIGDEGVHILDPFTGTGTFIVNLLEDKSLISDAQIENKYRNELHANEIVLLAYYIASINIEHAYHSRHEGKYETFPGALLTDTFQQSEKEDQTDMGFFIDNSERILQQMETPIHVVLGNPPYSKGQRSANDNNQNESYKDLDNRISETYVAGAKANNKNALYDQYIRAFRWASDRIENEGIVAFVTNGGWLDGKAMAGFRKCLVEEFNKIYVFNLRGNQRTKKEESRREGGKIFGSGSRAAVAITLLVKNPDSEEHGKIYYHDIGDYLTREQKLTIVRENINDIQFEWDEITPDRHHDWINKRDESWYDLAPIGINKLKQPCGIFETWSSGLKTQRDAWAWNFSKQSVEHNMAYLIENYNTERERYAAANSTKEPNDFVEYDNTKCKWTDNLFKQAKKNNQINFDQTRTRLALYRPFSKQYVYYDKLLNERTYQQPKIYPMDNPEIENRVIIVSSSGAFTCFISDYMPDLGIVSSSQCFPLYWYEKKSTNSSFIEEEETVGNYIRHDAITDEALHTFRKAYHAEDITKKDIFYYVYGILHSPDYRKHFESNLKKELPRIPLVKEVVAFRIYSKAGRDLADYHINYDKGYVYQLTEIGDSQNPGPVKKMKWAKKKDTKTKKKVDDYTTLIYNENLTLSGIPEDAQNYTVNGRSPVDWLIDRYEVKTDKDTGIVNDPNDFSDDPLYIVKLIKRVIHVSLKSLEIIRSLPPLDIMDQPEDWPEAWKS